MSTFLELLDEMIHNPTVAGLDPDGKPIENWVPLAVRSSSRFRTFSSGLSSISERVSGYLCVVCVCATEHEVAGGAEGTLLELSPPAELS